MTRDTLLTTTKNLDAEERTDINQNALKINVSFNNIIVCANITGSSKATKPRTNMCELKNQLGGGSTYTCRYSFYCAPQFNLNSRQVWFWEDKKVFLLTVNIHVRGCVCLFVRARIIVQLSSFSIIIIIFRQSREMRSTCYCSCSKGGVMKFFLVVKWLRDDKVRYCFLFDL